MNAINLAQKKCEPCEGGVKPFDKQKAQELLGQIPGWQLSGDAKTISRDYNAKNFMTAVNFMTQVAAVAESENHHPDIHLTGYRKLRIDLSTHAIGGLSENDFIVAAKINELSIELKK